MQIYFLNLNSIKNNVCRLLYWPNLTDNSLTGSKWSNSNKFISMYFYEWNDNDIWYNSTKVDSEIKGYF